MREFREEETEHIISIVRCCKSDDWKGMQFNSIFYSILKRSILLKPKFSQGFELTESESDNREEKEKYKNAILYGYIPIENLINLLRYLESNNLISFTPNYYQEWIDQELDDFMVICPGIDEETTHEKTKIIEEAKRRFTIKDPQAIDFLKEKYSYLISPSYELIDLVENDFKSIEQRRFETELETAQGHHKIAIKKAQKQICIAWSAFGVAVITLFANICFNYFGAVNVKYPEIEKQLNQIKQEIIKQKQPEVIKAHITNDTIKVKVLETQENKK